MPKTLKEADALRWALDELRGTMTAEEALRLIMILTLLRREADSTEWRPGPPGNPPQSRAVWTEVLSGERHGHEAVEWIQHGVQAWERRLGRDTGLKVPPLERAHDHRLASVIDAVGAVSDPVVLFELCLEAQSRMAGKGGQYYTPRNITHLLVGLLAPRAGDTVYDPACGSGGFLLAAHRFVAAHGGPADRPGLHGQDAGQAALQVAAMNLAVHGVTAELADPASSLLDDRFQRRTFDVVLANPPFNQTHWDDAGQSSYDPRWSHGVPPRGNANFAWVQHCVSKMSPTGRAAILLPNGAASGARPAERHIRAHLVQADLLDCVVELPAGLIPHVRNPVCLWLFSRSKQPHRSGQVLFIDAREAARSMGRGQRVIPDEAGARITDTYAAWREADRAEPHADVPGWCRVVTVEEIARQEYDVLPAHHVGAVTDDTEAHHRQQRVADLTAELYRHFEESHLLERELRELLGRS